MPDWVDEFRTEVATEHPDVVLWIHRATYSGVVLVAKILVPQHMRGKGIGDAILAALLAQADAHGDRVALTADTTWGGSKTRLTRWYRRLGFVRKSPRADHDITEELIREPLKP